MGTILSVIGVIAMIFFGALVFIPGVFRFVAWLKKVSNPIDGDIVDANIVLSQSEQDYERLQHDFEVEDEEDEYENEEDDDSTVRVAIYQGNGYWIAEDGFKTAPIDEDEEVQYSLTQEVDTMSVGVEELETLMEILDALKEREE